MNWIPVALLLTITTYAVVLYVLYRGGVAVSSQRMGQDVSHSQVSKLYSRALKHPASTVGFYLCVYEIPIGVFILTATIISPEATSLLAQYLWFFLILVAAGFVAALAAPKTTADTGTEKEESSYWSDLEDCREEIRNAAIKEPGAGYLKPSLRPSSKHDVRMIAEEAITLKLSEKCIDLWLWEAFDEYEHRHSEGAPANRLETGNLRNYWISRNGLMSREDDAGRAFAASLSRWEAHESRER
jgi:hypothetical protein